MALTVTHAFNVAIADDPKASAAGEVLPSHWNANHTISGDTFVVLETGSTSVLRTPANPAIGPISSTIISDGNFNAFPGLALYGPTSNQLMCNYLKASTVNTTDGIWYYKISTDMGNTWGTETLLYNPGSGNTAQDTNATTLSNGNILVSGFRVIGATTSVIVIPGTVSAAGAITFGSPVSVGNTLFTSNLQATTSPAIQLSNGTLVLPVYGVVSGDTNNSTGVTFSTDNGATWGSAVLVVRTDGNSNWDEALGFQLEGGNIVLIIRQDSNAGGASPGYYRTVSTDNGLTWSVPSLVVNFGGTFVGEGRPAPTYLGNNRVFMWVRSTGSLHPNSQWSYSTDAGVTWAAWTSYKPGNNAPFYNYAANVKVSNYLIASVLARGETGNSAPCDVAYQSFVE